MTKTTLRLQSLMISSLIAVALLSMTVSNSFAVPSGNSHARADPEPYIPPGPVDCVGLTDIPSVAQIECELYDDVECPVGPGVPCAEASDMTATSPPTFTPVPGDCTSGCNEFRVTFDPAAAGADLTPGNELHFKILFKDANGDLITVSGKDTRIHSFLVIPESPIGAAALVASSLAAFGAYMYLRSRKSASILSGN